ncbi:MAG: aminomethyl-transferring glycine dehydrogenase subunit GcvPB, partial [Gemmatimonadota bacterium]
KTMDIAKRLLDFGFHAPTVYFPLNVPEALMTEPTETETRESLERYAAACIAIVKEAESNPELVTTAPHDTPIRRLDEGRAARELDLRWTFETEE